MGTIFQLDITDTLFLTELRQKTNILFSWIECQIWFSGNLH